MVLAWTTEAIAWLEEIAQYIKEDNPRAAERTIRGIKKQSKILEKFPLMGHKLKVDIDREIRILLYGHYRIAYEIKKSENKIFILGVYHGSLDIKRYLK